MKKFFNFCLAVLAVMAFTACGSDDDGNLVVTPAQPIPEDVVSTADVVCVYAPENALPEVGTDGTASVRFSRFEVNPDGTATITLSVDPVAGARQTRSTDSEKRIEVVSYTFTTANDSRIYTITGSDYLKSVTVSTVSGNASASITLTNETSPNVVLKVDKYRTTEAYKLYATWNISGVRIKLIGKNGHDNYFKYYEGCNFPEIREDLKKHDANIDDLDGFDKKVESLTISPFGSFTLNYADETNDGGNDGGNMINLQGLSWKIDWFNQEDVNKYLRDASFVAAFNVLGYHSKVHQLCITGTAALEELNYSNVNVEFYLDRDK